jgi:hypothetical protein
VTACSTRARPAKSALPRLSSSSLVFSKDGTCCNVALISATLSRELGTQELKVPVATWAASADRLLQSTSADSPLTHAQRAKSLELLTQHTPFRTERALLEQQAPEAQTTPLWKRSLRGLL